MARKDEILHIRDVLVVRRDALRRALAGDLSLLSELRNQGTGDVIDAALDSAQGEINSQLAEVAAQYDFCSADGTPLEEGYRYSSTAATNREIGLNLAVLSVL